MRTIIKIKNARLRVSRTFILYGADIRLVEPGGVDGLRLTLGVRLSSRSRPKNKRTAQSEPHVHLLVDYTHK